MKPKICPNCGEPIEIDTSEHAPLLQAFCPECDEFYDPLDYISEEEHRGYNALGIACNESEWNGRYYD